MTTNPNTLPRIAGRFLANTSIAFGPLVAALIINRWNHDAAVILANLWLAAFLVMATQRRHPGHYNSYPAWFADRANWWKPFPQKERGAYS